MSRFAGSHRQLQEPQGVSSWQRESYPMHGWTRYQTHFKKGSLMALVGWGCLLPKRR